MDKVAVVVGATGLIGRNLCQLLLERNDLVETIAITRKPIKIDGKGLRNIVLKDFANLEDLAGDLRSDLDTYGFCCLGTTMKAAGSKSAFRTVDYDYVLSFARLCHAIGAKHTSFVSALGANAKAMSFYSRTKGEAELAIQDLSLPSASILQPSLLTGQRDHFRLGESLAKPLMSWLPLSIRSIDGFAVAKAMIEVAWDEKPGTHTYRSRDIQIIARA